MAYDYEDRGMKKWMGMYLSEHTKQMTERKEQAAIVVPQRPQMTLEEIGEVLSKAQIHNSTVVLQKEERDMEGRYKSDIIGNISGYDETGIYINSNKVDYDEIRNVQIAQHVKWSDTSQFLEQ